MAAQLVEDGPQGPVRSECSCAAASRGNQHLSAPAEAEELSMIPELLWELNPNLDAAAKVRLHALAEEGGRAKCNAIIDNAKETMTDEELALFLPLAMQVMVWM
jgi:hypothetical protein